MALALRPISILLADSDIHLSPVVRSVLSHFGMPNVTMVRSGGEAYDALKSRNFDLVLTEWELKGHSGIDLIHYIRRDRKSSNPFMPVIMLTARSDESDVIAARDAGITEYLLKPLTAKAISHRITQVVDHPRPFVFSTQFVGPDRRRRMDTSPLVSERRDMRNARKVVAKDAPSLKRSDAGTQHVMAEFELKRKLGLSASITQALTDEVLAKGQSIISEASQNSLAWLAEDIAQIESACEDLAAGQKPEHALDELKMRALSLKARAGTFGHTHMSEIAWMLYRFCRQMFDNRNPTHPVVILKHLQGLKVMLGDSGSNDMHTLGKALIHDLGELTRKYS